MAKIAVAPLVGAWIEIPQQVYLEHLTWSLPSWERGLKCQSARSDRIPFVSLPSWERGLKYMTVLRSRSQNCVAPLVGAWIEIVVRYVLHIPGNVAPLVGAWIEIRKSDKILL